MIILYADGIAEAMDTSGNNLVHKGLIELARGLATESRAEVSQALMSGTQAFRGDEPPRGDETLVVLRRVME